MTEAVTVRAEMTPNPSTVRFVVNREINATPVEYKSAPETLNSPLAKKLFGFPWTAGVFIGRDFVSVTKQDWVDWEVLEEPLTGLIQEHLESGDAVVRVATGATTASASANDSDDVKLIKEVLDTEIRPAVAQDGGDIAFHKFEDGVVYLFMQGSCAGCPSSTMTLKMGIETRLMERVPSVKEVVAVNG